MPHLGEIMILSIVFGMTLIGFRFLHIKTKEIEDRNKESKTS